MHSTKLLFDELAIRPKFSTKCRNRRSAVRRSVAHRREPCENGMYGLMIIVTLTASEFLIAAHRLIMLYIVPKFVKISQRISEPFSRQNCILKFIKGPIT